MSAQGFDLAALEQNDTAVIPLAHPVTGDPIGATITVYGQDSDVFRAESNRTQAKRAEYKMRHRNKEMPPEMSDQLFKTQMIACVKSIDGLVYNGEPMTDPADVFSRFPWIYEQAIAGVTERENFIKGL